MLHVTASYSGMLLIRDSFDMLQHVPSISHEYRSSLTVSQAFSPIIDTIQDYQQEKESGDSFSVPMKIDIPASFQEVSIFVHLQLVFLNLLILEKSCEIF